MINTQKSYTYLNNKFGLKKSSKGWFTYECPICKANGYKNKMAVNFNSEFVKCWSASCYFGRGSISDFVAYIENFDSIFEARMFIENYEASNIDFESNNERRGVVKSSVKLPKGFNSILAGEGLLAKRARNYLSRRGFDLKILDREGYGYCDEEHKDFHKNYYGYIIVPFIVAGKLEYFLGRDFLGRNEKYKYKNPKFDIFGVEKSEWLFNEDAIYMYKEVFLNEGWADAKTIGKQGISSQGWNLSQKQKTKILRSNIERLVIVADRGAYKEAVKTARLFLNKKEIFVVNFDDKELADFGKDVNDVGLDRFMKVYSKTKPMTDKEAIRILTK